MKSDQILDALSSIAEIALFVWSLLELLLTRILPLLGYLVGLLLLQLGSLLSSVAKPRAADRRNQSRADQYRFYSWDGQLQAAAEEEVSEEEQSVQIVKEDNNDQSSFERFIEELSTDEEPEDISPREESSISPDFTEDEEAQAVAPAAVYQNVELLAQSTPLEGGRVTAFQDAADAGQVPAGSHGGIVHVAEVPPLDSQRFDLHLSGFGGKNSGVDRVEAKHVSPKPDVAAVEAKHVSPKAESGAAKMDSEPSDVQRSGELQKNSSRRSRRIRVLPPSLSQVKRTLMQRSRRASTSPATALAPSPSPIQKKQLRGSRRRTSPTLRSSPSYNSFVRRFREHFLLDPV